METGGAKSEWPDFEQNYGQHLFLALNKENNSPNYNTTPGSQQSILFSTIKIAYVKGRRIETGRAKSERPDFKQNYGQHLILAPNNENNSQN